DMVRLNSVDSHIPENGFEVHQFFFIVALRLRRLRRENLLTIPNRYRLERHIMLWVGRAFDVGIKPNRNRKLSRELRPLARGAAGDVPVSTALPVHPAR